jgi:hypothetical protein
VQSIPAQYFTYKAAEMSGLRGNPPILLKTADLYHGGIPLPRLQVVTRRGENSCEIGVPNEKANGCGICLCTN